MPCTNHKVLEFKMDVSIVDVRQNTHCAKSISGTGIRTIETLKAKDAKYVSLMLDIVHNNPPTTSSPLSPTLSCHSTSGQWFPLHSAESHASQSLYSHPLTALRDMHLTYV